MSHRVAQVESILKRRIAEVLQRRISDPRIEEGMVSITRVQVSPDLHDAYVWVSVLPEEKQKVVLSGLRHASPHIQKLVQKGMAMRTMPRLAFRLDDTLKKEAGIYDAIRRGVERSGEADEDGGESEVEGETGTDRLP